MGLVKTGRRLAEDMHRRGEASGGTLPKATRRARKRVRSPYQAARPESAPYQAMQKQQRAKAGAEVLPMWKCCQFQCCQFPIVDWQRQTTEWNVAKLPNGMLPNCRTDSRQTTERFCAKLPNGYCVA